MAPEQAAGQRVDERADLYSLALVLYEALAGLNPVRAGSPAATARRVGTVLPALRRSRKDLPEELGAAIDRALRPRPDERGNARRSRGGVGGVAPRGLRRGRDRRPAPARADRALRGAPARPRPRSRRAARGRARRERTGLGGPAAAPGGRGRRRGRGAATPRLDRRGGRDDRHARGRGSGRRRARRRGGGACAIAPEAKGNRLVRPRRWRRCSGSRASPAHTRRSPAGRADRSPAPRWAPSGPGGRCSPDRSPRPTS